LIYVSLPVHTQPAVIAGQLNNFAHFFPEARVVLHVSAEARFTLGALAAALAARRCANAIINPHRASTGWGNILAAHLANIAWIRAQGDASRICLHASNDMLVRPGLAAWLSRGGNFLNQRQVVPGSYWRFAKPALADPALQLLCQQLGNAPVVASQVEGASFEAPVLFELAALLAPALASAAPARYPREEVWLSTAAHALLAPPAGRAGGRPYVFSEIHRFDRVFWQVLRRLDPLLGGPGDPRHPVRRAIEYAMIKSGFHRIDRRWVDRIAHNATRELAPYEFLSDGNYRWQVFDCHGLFGVKRVPRRTGSRLRAYIDSMAAPAPRQHHVRTP
jgi:hypothetical protein